MLFWFKFKIKIAQDDSVSDTAEETETVWHHWKVFKFEKNKFEMLACLIFLNINNKRFYRQPRFQSFINTKNIQ